MASDQSTVAIVKCESYDPQKVTAAVRTGFELLGGAGRFVRSGEKIVLKPNVLAPVGPEKCATTHPEVFRAVAEMLLGQEDIRLSYGDSPGVPLAPSAVAMKRAGYAGIAAQLRIPQADFDHGKLVAFPEGTCSKQLFLANAVLDNDGLVSLPKFKTHGLVRFTGAVKNQYGCVPGMVKGEYHARFPDPTDFSALCADICARVAPRLYVMDAIVAMEGNGPQSGTPRTLGLLLFSTDPVALDTVCCKLIDLDPQFVPTNAAGLKAGLGTMDTKRIRILGTQLETACDTQFDVVRRPPSRLPSNPFIRVIRNVTTRRPVIHPKKCTRCGMCIKVCPVDPKAVRWRRENRRKPPVYSYDRCIRCFCCQESCPSSAIAIKRPLLGRLLPPLSFLALLAARRSSKKESRHHAAKGQE